MRVFVPLTLVIVTAVAGCGRQAQPVAPKEQDWFVDRARESGLDFVHVNGMSGKLYMPEVLAPGVALFDFDNDGDLDVYLVQGRPLSSSAGLESKTRPTPLGDLNGRLFRNDLRVNSDGTRTLRFTDVTRESGIVTPGYGMGVAAGDFNNDGWVDLYLTKFDAPNQLLRNNGNGTFTDVSKSSGTDLRSWSVSASFVDVNRDGWLDLYVGNYVRYSLEHSTQCFGASGALDYCMPDAYQPLQDRLFINRGDGTFADASVTSGIAREYGPALGVSTADFNGDGWMDIYVANDGKENQLWLNKKDGTFENVALLSGVALPVTGKAEASMGVDAGDFDDDGDEDLFMTELTSQGSNLYVNDGSAVFDDRSTPSGVGPASVPFTGFGTGWFDYDNDGRLDLLSVNGTVQIIESLRQARIRCPCISGNSCSITSAAADSRRSVLRRVQCSRYPRSAAVRHSATSTTTATSTSSSATTTDRHGCSSTRPRTGITGSACGWPGSADATCLVPVLRSFRPVHPRAGAGLARTVATPPPTIRVSSSDWESPRVHRTCGSPGRTARSKPGRTSTSIGTRR